MHWPNQYRLATTNLGKNAANTRPYAEVSFDNSGMVEFGLSRQPTDIVTVDRRSNGKNPAASRLASTPHWQSFQNWRQMAVAGYFETSDQVLACLRKAGSISTPVLWRQKSTRPLSAIEIQQRTLPGAADPVAAETSYENDQRRWE